MVERHDLSGLGPVSNPRRTISTLVAAGLQPRARVDSHEHVGALVCIRSDHDHQLCPLIDGR